MNLTKGKNKVARIGCLAWLALVVFLSGCDKNNPEYKRIEVKGLDYCDPQSFHVMGTCTQAETAQRIGGTDAEIKFSLLETAHDNTNKYVRCDEEPRRINSLNMREYIVHRDEQSGRYTSLYYASDGVLSLIIDIKGHAPVMDCYLLKGIDDAKLRDFICRDTVSCWSKIFHPKVGEIEFTE